MLVNGRKRASAPPLRLEAQEQLLRPIPRLLIELREAVFVVQSMPPLTPYTRSYSFTDFQTGNPSSPLPGIQVDNELENVEQSLNEAIGAIKDVRRSDGKLKNGIVTVDSLDPTVAAGIGAGALASASAAAASAAAAADSAEASAASAEAASGSATTAATSVVQANDALEDAQIAQGQADAARTGAQTARDFAAAWSSAPEGVDVNDGVNPVGKSAFHWAKVALGAATGVLPDGSVSEPKLDADLAAKVNGALQGATYDPNGVEADAFDRSNHTGVQPMSSVTGLAELVPFTRHQRVVDAHFRCMKGAGALSAVDIGEYAYTIAAPILADATSFSYTGTTPTTNQLIVFLGTDGEYYTNVIASASGGTCTLLGPMEASVAAGANCWNFFSDNAHPNTRGYKAIADYALREDFAVWTKVAKLSPVPLTSTIEVAASNFPTNPGSLNSKSAWTVTPSGAESGAIWTWNPTRSGWHRFSFECNALISGNVTLIASQASLALAQRVITTRDARRHDLDIFVPNTNTVSITAVRNANAFIFSDITVYRLDGEPLEINRGKHLVLGDSWVAVSNGVGEQLGARLDRAEVLKSGVGGNLASSLIERFLADVASISDLDFVWVVVGANDAATGIAPSVFAAQISYLCALIAGIGATPILVTPFTGSDDHNERYDYTRRYVDQVAYYNTEATKVTRYNIAAYVPVGGTVAVLSLGLIPGKFRVVESYLSHSCNLNRGTNHPALTAGLGTIASGYVTTPSEKDFRPMAQFVQLFRTSGGSAENVTGYIDIEVG